MHDRENYGRLVSIESHRERKDARTQPAEFLAMFADSLPTMPTRSNRLHGPVNFQNTTRRNEVYVL